MRENPFFGVTLLLFAGCAADHAGIARCGTVEADLAERITFIDRVDLLFVIDDSPSMAAERASLVNEIPRIVHVLASGDRDRDGEPDFIPVESIHVAAVTTDLGAPADAASCEAGIGDDGLLIRASVGTVGCDAEHDSGIFDFTSATDDPIEFATQIGCTAFARTDGCGVEQPLEATLRALSLRAPTSWTHAGYEPPIFGDGSSGHGDGANAGFLRPDSLLTVVVLTDEDDCSVADVGAELSSVDPTEGDPSCTGAGGLLPVERFVRGLVGLRAHEQLVTFTVVGGVPQALVDEGASYDAILAAPEMQPTADPARPGHLLPSCTNAHGAEATPSPRLVRVAAGLEELGASTSVISICGDSFLSVADPIIARARQRPSGICLERALAVDEEGRADARVDVILAPTESGDAVTRCADIEGTTRLPDVLENWRGSPVLREVCRLPVLTRAEATTGRRGWFYDDGDPRLGEASMLPSGCPRLINVSRVVFNGSAVRISYPAVSGDLPYCEE